MRFRQRVVPVTASGFGMVNTRAAAAPTRLKNSGLNFRSVFA